MASDDKIENIGLKNLNDRDSQKPLNTQTKQEPIKKSYNPPMPWHYFTNWSLFILITYETIVTFFVDLKNNNSNFEAFMIRFHYMNFALQFFISIFYFAFLYNMLRKRANYYSTATYLSYDLLHVRAFVI